MSGGDTEKEKVKMVSGGDVWDICPRRSMSGWNPEKEKMRLVSESGDWDILSMRVMEAKLGKPSLHRGSDTELLSSAQLSR